MDILSIVGRRWGPTFRPTLDLALKRWSSTNQASFREAMAGVASSPMIITTSHRVNGSQAREPRGITLSSVTSLSLNPEILISFNIQVPSRTSEVLHDRGLFALNMLDSSPQSAQLCKVFAGQLGRTVNPFEVEKHLFLWNDHGDENAMDIPTVIDAMAVLYCEKKRVIRVQDHEIWIARVSDIKTKHMTDGHVDKNHLVYYRRGFHSVGPKVKDQDQDQ